MKVQPFIIAGLGLILIGAGFYFRADVNQKSAAIVLEPSFTIRGTEFKAIISDTPALRKKGLSGRESLGAGQAMVFIFDRPELVGFWMKDMRFSIDILFLDDSMRVISFARNVSPQTFPESFYPDAPARYVVEFVAGTLDRLGVKKGDLTEIRL
ncbi:MAG: DUF192 domain-containing protein [bacterium]|nr:DUF192 domain-containing protein [bacterium]